MPSWGIRNFEILARYDKSEIELLTEEFMQNNFVKELNGWTLQGVTTKEVFSQCFGRDLFGGFNIFLKGTTASKQYENLPEHLGIIVNLDLWLIDSFTAEDSVEIVIDGQIYQKRRSDFIFNDNLRFCGNQDVSDRQSLVSLFFPHTKASMKLTIRAMFMSAQGQKSFGIQNLRILTSNCPKERCKIFARQLVDTTIDKEAGWVALVGTNGAAFPTSLKTCQKVTYLFGSRTRILKKFEGLPKHNRIIISFKILTTGSWPSQSVMVNDITGDAYVSNDFEQFKACSQIDPDTIRNYYLDMAHRNSYLEFQVLAKLSNQQSGFSIIDFVLLTYEDPDFSRLSFSEFTEKQFQETSITGWTVKGNFNSNLVTSCGQFSLFGGYNRFGVGTTISKTFTNLPTHEYLHLTFELYIIDSWDNEDLNVFIDNQFVSSTNNTKSWIGTENICGRVEEEEPKVISILSFHTLDQVTVTLQDTLNQLSDDESWGIRNFHLAVGVFNAQDHKEEPQDFQCSIIYSECSFKGDSLEVWDGILDRENSSWKVHVQSVKIPKGQTFHIIRGPSYDSSQECITQE